MTNVVGEMDTRKQQLVEYIKYLKGDESIRSLAARAGVSHGVVGELLTGTSIPKADTLKKIGDALGAEEARLMLLAGYLDEIPASDLHPRAATLAQRISALGESTMVPVLEALEAQFNTLVRVMGRSENAPAEGQGTINPQTYIYDFMTACLDDPEFTQGRAKMADDKEAIKKRIGQGLDKLPTHILKELAEIAKEAASKRRNRAEAAAVLFRTLGIE